MKRKRRAAAPLRRGPAVLLGDGCLLLLVLAGTVFSFLTAFSVQIHALPLLLGCAAAALAFLGLWSLPRRWWALPLALLAAAGEENVWLWTASGYRSEERQQALLDHAVRENREAGMEAGQALEDALRTIALPGHSEHQTGLALDFNDVSGDFALTEAYRWLQEHGAEYGFIQRYPAGKESVTGIAEESWHYRYVGRPHAQAMKRLGLCLEEYVLYVKAGGEG